MKSNTRTEKTEVGLEAISLNQRESWKGSAIVWAGCEFSIAVIMTGAGIIDSFTLKQFFIILLFSIIAFTWVTDGLNSYMGALSGRSSSVLGRSAFGSNQAKWLISILTFINLVGWWAINTSLSANALCTVINIDYTVQRGYWTVMTIIVGILFTIPPFFGYHSIKWVDYIALPAGLLLCIGAFYLSLKNMGGLSVMWNYQPSGNMRIGEAMGLLIGANVAQLIIMADYTRFVRPKFKDAFLVPIGVVLTGIALFTMGAIMGMGKGGSFDLVMIMQELGFGWWGFVVLWLAQWTSQLVAIYSMGLILSNLFDARTEKQRRLYTVLGSVIGLVLSLGGLLDRFTSFLYFTSLVYPAVGAILIVDFFLLRDKVWEDKKGWNWIATISFVGGVGIGYYTQYINPIGIPAAQSYLASGIMYYVLTYIKAKSSPDIYSPEKWVSIKH